MSKEKLQFCRQQVERKVLVPLVHGTKHMLKLFKKLPNRKPNKSPPLEQLEKELGNYVKHLTEIHQAIFQQVKSAEGIKS